MLSVGGLGVTDRRVAPLLWAGTGRAWGLSVPSKPQGQICKVGGELTSQHSKNLPVQEAVSD